MDIFEQFRTKIQEFLLKLGKLCEKNDIDVYKNILTNEFNILWIKDSGKDFQLIEWTNNEQDIEKITNFIPKKYEDIKINLFGPFSTEANSAEEYNKIMEFFKGKHTQNNQDGRHAKFKFLEEKFLNEYFHNINSFPEVDFIPQKYPEEFSGKGKYYIITFSNILNGISEDMAEDFIYNISPDFMDAYSLYKN